MHVTKEGIDRLKAANPLEVILADRRIELRKKGRVLVARCPFHEEKTASFTVTPTKGLFHCFGCGARGDVFGFITKRDKVGFPRAMEILARRPRRSRRRPWIRRRPGGYLLRWWGTITGRSVKGRMLRTT